MHFSMRHREEIRSLLRTDVAAHACCDVACVGTRFNLARLNLKPASHPIGLSAPQAAGYALIGSSNADTVRLGKRSSPRSYILYILLLLGVIGVVVLTTYRTSSMSKTTAPPAVVTPPRGSGSGKLSSTRSKRRSQPPQPRLEYGSGEFTALPPPPPHG